MKRRTTIFHRFAKLPPGSLLISVLIITSLLTTLGLLGLNLLISQNAATNFRVDREKAFEIAEAGVDYYRWHLAHVPDDYQDGTGAAGPYVHQYTDAVGNVLGTFSLTITPPPSGSTVVTITSTGVVTNKPSSSRTVTVKQGIPSFTQYAVVANADMRFGVGTEVFGPIHSNGGIRFDGLAHNLVSSKLGTYNDPDHSGADEFGVHTHVAPTDPLPPAAVPSRVDVFQVGRQFPVPQVDFNAISADLAAIKTKAQASGIYLTPSAGQGYHITLRTDDKIDIRMVNVQLACQYNNGGFLDYGYCSNNYNQSCTQDSTCSGSGGLCIKASHSIGTRVNDEVSFTYQSASSLGITMPANGIIYADDDLWVDGQIDSARLTIVATSSSADPVRRPGNIFINKDLTYTNYDGQDAIGLIAQKDVLVGFFSEDDLRVDAALIAQNGHVGRPYYGSGFTSSTSNANFRLYPDTGVCTANSSQTCTSNAQCTDYCTTNPSRTCTTNGQCNNYCIANTSKTCNNNGECNNYCQAETTRACTTGADCRYCQGDPTRTCASGGGSTANQKCNGRCTGNANKGCWNNSDCTGFGTCDRNAPDVGPCSPSVGPCITGDSCKLGDTCVATGDSCSLSTNPAGTTTCQEYRSRDTITTFGSLATNQRYGFAWVGNLFNCAVGTNDSGYCTRNLNFDSNLTYAPPPDFPTTGQYKTISWEEQ